MVGNPGTRKNLPAGSKGVGGGLWTNHLLYPPILVCCSSFSYIYTIISEGFVITSIRPTCCWPTHYHPAIYATRFLFNKVCRYIALDAPPPSLTQLYYLRSHIPEVCFVSASSHISLFNAPCQDGRYVISLSKSEWNVSFPLETHALPLQTWWRL